jgi:hypothetical protein
MACYRQSPLAPIPNFSAMPWRVVGKAHWPPRRRSHDMTWHVACKAHWPPVFAAMTRHITGKAHWSPCLPSHEPWHGMFQAGPTGLPLSSQPPHGMLQAKPPSSQPPHGSLQAKAHWPTILRSHEPWHGTLQAMPTGLPVFAALGTYMAYCRQGPLAIASSQPPHGVLKARGKARCVPLSSQPPHGMLQAKPPSSQPPPSSLQAKAPWPPILRGHEPWHGTLQARPTGLPVFAAPTWHAAGKTHLPSRLRSSQPPHGALQARGKAHCAPLSSQPPYGVLVLQAMPTGIPVLQPPHGMLQATAVAVSRPGAYGAWPSRPVQCNTGTEVRTAYCYLGSSQHTRRALGYLHFRLPTSTGMVISYRNTATQCKKGPLPPSDFHCHRPGIHTGKTH